MDKKVKTSQETIINEPRFCIPREISEEEAILSLAEGWSTMEPPTQEMLENSYYAKAFEKVKQGKWTWNWSAACLGMFWLFSKKMTLSFFIFLNIRIPILILNGAFSVSNSGSHQNTYESWLALAPPIVEFIFLGLFGNRLLLKNAQRKHRKGYALWRCYHVYKCHVLLILIASVSRYLELAGLFIAFAAGCKQGLCMLVFSFGLAGPYLLNLLLTHSICVFVYEKIMISDAKKEHKQRFPDQEAYP